MIKTNDFFNKLANNIDKIYFPTINSYHDDKNYMMAHYAIELFNNNCLTYHELVKRLAKACDENTDTIHSITKQYIEDFEGYIYMKPKVIKEEEDVKLTDTFDSDDKLVCLFMGIKPKSVTPDLYYWDDSPFFYVSEHTPEKVMDAIIKYVKYRTSWDWLIPVVKKCLIGEGENGYNYQNLYDAICKVNITDTFNEVINYIKWYNAQK